MDLFVRVFEYLLPQARAFFFWASGSQLREFFEGLAGLPTDVRAFYDNLWLQIWPSDTDQLDEWEEQFALQNATLTEAERRTRLDAAWSATGGQSPRYLQDLVQAHGFDVFIHSWWDPDLLPAAVVRDPTLFLSGSVGPVITAACDEALMQCGEALAQCNERLDPAGYLLVNKIRTVEVLSLGCGEALAQAGEQLIQCGQPLAFDFGFVEYFIPVDEDEWRYILYWGGEVFGEQAQVAANRKDEFEELLLKYCPGQQWLGIMVDYV